MRAREDEILADVFRRMLLDPASMVSLEEERVRMVSVDGCAVVTAEELEVVRELVRDS